MTEEELIGKLEMIQRMKSESNILELKSAEKGCPQHLYDSLSSFSNQDEGGIIIFGIDEKQDYKELPDTYVIFITEKDYYKAGKPVYVIRNMNLTLGLPFEDGTHILYVNGEYRDDSDIGKLMHDFNCTSAEEMNFDLMAERTRYLKENPKGVGSMCKAMEELRVESYTEGKAEGVEIGKMEQAKKTALKLSRKGNSVEEIADLLGYDVDTVSSWIAPKAC